MSMRNAAVLVAEAARFVPTLSLDEPMAEVAPWRWFTAAGWMGAALGETQLNTAVPAPGPRPAAPPAPPPRPAPDPSPRAAEEPTGG